MEFLIAKAHEQGQECLETVIECRNNKDRTPIIEACLRGYQTVGREDEAKENRLAIVSCLIEAGADPNSHRAVTRMTPMHWAAYNGDEGVIRYLLEQEGVDPFIYSHDNLLPIDTAGYRPSVQCLDVMLQHFQKENDLHGTKQFKGGRMKDIDRILDELNRPVELHADKLEPNTKSRKNHYEEFTQL